MMDIREIEKIIDEEHKNSPVFYEGKEQTIFDLLTTFEDTCGQILMGSLLNPFALKRITDQMDALNISLLWADQLCHKDTESLRTVITETRYEECCELLTKYAYPYSVICSGYISYSRKRFDAEITGNRVTFNPCANQNSSMWSDIIREASDVDFNAMFNIIDPFRLSSVINELKEQVEIENDYICYSLCDRHISIFKDLAEKQWDVSKTLPDNWRFDSFSLNEYKEFWVSLTALCYIHFCNCFAIADLLVRIKNSTIIQNINSIVEYIEAESKLPKEKIEAIIKYITFDPKKKNVDIMYQPIVMFEDETLIIAPILFMGSRPERNLLSVISSAHDREYSKEVNKLEGLMVGELESTVLSQYKAKHKHLRDDLPDVDFAVFDETTNSALICETKWFAAADSTKEVLSKEDEITHGCQQIESIMLYAMSNKVQFIKQVFNVDVDGDSVDLFGCVVAKHNIRTQHKYIPVIDLKRIKELFSKYPLNSVFHIIRNHEFELPLPEDATITHTSVYYAGFEFRIPAICFGFTQGNFQR